MDGCVGRMWRYDRTVPSDLSVVPLHLLRQTVHAVRTNTRVLAICTKQQLYGYSSCYNKGTRLGCPNVHVCGLL